MEKFLRRLHEIKVRADRTPEDIAPFIVAMVQENISNMTGPPNSPLTKTLKGDKGPLKDTGVLRASLSFVVSEQTITVGTMLPYAPILHFGGVKKAKKAKKLAIPLTKKIKKWTDVKGVKGFLQMLESQGWKIFFTKKAIVGTPPAGGQKYGLTMKGNKKSQLLFVRKKSVKIPRRPYMRLTKKQADELKKTVLENLIK